MRDCRTLSIAESIRRKAPKLPRDTLPRVSIVACARDQDCGEPPTRHHTSLPHRCGHRACRRSPAAVVLPNAWSAIHVRSRHAGRPRPRHERAILHRSASIVHCHDNYGPRRNSRILRRRIIRSRVWGNWDVGCMGVVCVRGDSVVRCVLTV